MRDPFAAGDRVVQRAALPYRGLERRAQLQRWLHSEVGGGAFILHPLPPGASSRQFYRLQFADGRRSLIVRDAPSAGDSERFVRVALLLGNAGVHAPVIIAQNLACGFVLMSDLGDTTYLSVLNHDNADSLLDPAIDTLIRWQRASRPGSLPSVDERLLRREMNLFTQWYVHRHLGLTWDWSRRRALERAFDTIIANNLSQPIAYVHRDYTARNLVVCDPKPGVLDFQDATNGPITYDVASLFWSSTRDWPEERVRGWTTRYWVKARSFGLPVRDSVDEFWQSLTWTTIQRHLKMLGVFARLKYRAGKPQYLENSPRVLRRLRAIAATSSPLAPLVEMLDSLENPAAPWHRDPEGRRV